MKAVKLPKKPSALLNLALRDLERVERDKNYEIDMCEWHAPEIHDGKPVCHVCLAGSILVKTLKHKPDKEFKFNDYPKASNSFFAINAFRKGYVREALGNLGIEEVKISKVDAVRTITPYSINPAKFKLGMRRIVAHLRKHSL